MAPSFRNVVFACVLLLSIQQVALVVTCYSCNACSSVSSSTGTASNTYCYKAVGTLNGVTVVNRDKSLKHRNMTIFSFITVNTYLY